MCEFSCAARLSNRKEIFCWRQSEVTCATCCDTYAMVRLDHVVQAHLRASNASNTSLKFAQRRVDAGDVSVDGIVTREPKRQVVPGVEAVTLTSTGDALPCGDHAFYLMNKPTGCVCQRHPREADVYGLIPEADFRDDLVCVGRLDRDTTGTLLFGTDGGLQSIYCFPTSHVDKTYTAKCVGTLCSDAVQLFTAGMVLEDGTRCAPAHLEILSSDAEGSGGTQGSRSGGTLGSGSRGTHMRCRVTLHEGFFHQVKRMLAHCGANVVELHRERYGLLSANDLPLGAMRPLTAEEREALAAMLPDDRVGQKRLPPELARHREAGDDSGGGKASNATPATAACSIGTATADMSSIPARTSADESASCAEIRPTDPTDSVIRWGCIGTGFIAKAMAQQLGRVPGAAREAMCSASGTKDAAAVADVAAACGFARAVTLDELVDDPAIDVVYVASANSSHAEHCLRALRAGKHVLCEKPLTMSRAETDAVLDEATHRRRLIVDGTFTACLPAMGVIRAKLPLIGEVLHVEVHKKIRTSISHVNPILNSRDLGGGLFDGAGSYSVHAVCVIFGAEPILALGRGDVHVTSIASPDGQVDWDTTVRLQLGRASVVLTHRAADDARESVVRGTRGEISFTLPYLHHVRVNDVEIDTSYAACEQLGELAGDSPGAPHGLHPGLGIEALAVRREILAARTANGGDAASPGTSYLPLEVVRAMSHLMDLVRQQIPTHKHSGASSGAGAAPSGGPHPGATNGQLSSLSHK